MVGGHEAGFRHSCPSDKFRLHPVAAHGSHAPILFVRGLSGAISIHAHRDAARKNGLPVCTQQGQECFELRTVVTPEGIERIFSLHKAKDVETVRRFSGETCHSRQQRQEQNQ